MQDIRPVIVAGQNLNVSDSNDSRPEASQLAQASKLCISEVEVITSKKKSTTLDPDLQRETLNVGVSSPTPTADDKHIEVANRTMSTVLGNNDDNRINNVRNISCEIPSNIPDPKDFMQTPAFRKLSSEVPVYSAAELHYPTPTSTHHHPLPRTTAPPIQYQSPCTRPLTGLAFEMDRLAPSSPTFARVSRTAGGMASRLTKTSLGPRSFRLRGQSFKADDPPFDNPVKNNLSRTQPNLFMPSVDGGYLPSYPRPPNVQSLQNLPMTAPFVIHSKTLRQFPNRMSIRSSSGYRNSKIESSKRRINTPFDAVHLNQNFPAPSNGHRPFIAFREMPPKFPVVTMHQMRR